MIQVEHLNKHYGEQVLFKDASFTINPRERIGLVGRNGHGKTTFLRILSGHTSPDDGRIVWPKNYRIGYVHQRIAFTQNTVLDEGMQGLNTHERDHFWKVERILAGLGFTREDFERHPTEFSGGYQVRLNLAKILVAEPDLLLLDEPTNYLDITSIRWIERFLLNWPHELVLVTHDRGFMDRVVTHVVGIHRHRMRKLPGDTARYYAQIAQEEEIHEKTRLNDERRRKDIELFISRFRAKARLANLVQSRVKTLAKMQKLERLEKIRSLDFAFRSLSFDGRHLVQAQKIQFAYDGYQPLFAGLSLAVGARDRIAIIGRNGKGKTTLLKVLAGILPPRRGQVAFNPATVKGVFEQTHLSTLVDARTVEEEMLMAHPDVDRQTARNICGAMLFEGDAALKKVAVLSGGERSRVMLGKLLAQPLNLLLLDEPTHHLDMEACDALLAALDDFDGAVVVVTHNEMFLHALARRLIVFQRNSAVLFEGTYQDFLDRRGWEEEQEPLAADEPAPSVAAVDHDHKINKKERRRRRSEIINERSRLTKPLEQQAAQVENAIEAGEKKLDRLYRQMQQATEDQDGQAIGTLAQDLHNCQAEIDRLFEELEELTNALDAHHQAFEQRLLDLAPEEGSL